MYVGGGRERGCYLLDEDERLEGDVECGGMRDKEESVDVFVDSGVIERVLAIVGYKMEG